MSGRGGRGGARGGRGGGALRPGTTMIGGVELNWDLTGLNIDKKPIDSFPPRQPPRPPPPTDSERRMLKYYFAVRDRIHDGPFYTVLNDGMKNGLKRKANDPAPSEATLFNPFTDNQTYTSKYLKQRSRIPKLDARPYVVDAFPPELQSLVGGDPGGDPSTDRPTKKRKLQISKTSDATSRIDSYMQQQGQRLKDLEERGGEDDEDAEEEDDEDEDEKPDAVNEEDDWSAASSDSEESNDDYNAERYFDNGDDDDVDDGEGMEGAYE